MPVLGVEVRLVVVDGAELEIDVDVDFDVAGVDVIVGSAEVDVEEEVMRPDLKPA